MSEQDREYYRRRAAEELAAAMKASSDVAARAHRRMAERYLALTRDIPLESSQIWPELRSL